MAMTRYAAGFIHRAAYATLTAIVVWILYVFPFDPGSYRFRLAAVKVLDWPVAMVSRQMPPSLKAIDPFSDYPFAHNERAEYVLLLHLRLAVPVYILLFYLPSLIAAGLARLRRRKSGP